jgi:hypothetical protein
VVFINTGITVKYPNLPSSFNFSILAFRSSHSLCKLVNPELFRCGIPEWLMVVPNGSSPSSFYHMKRYLLKITIIKTMIKNIKIKINMVMVLDIWLFQVTRYWKIFILTVIQKIQNQAPKTKNTSKNTSNSCSNYEISERIRIFILLYFDPFKRCCTKYNEHEKNTSTTNMGR